MECLPSRSFLESQASGEPVIALFSGIAFTFLLTGLLARLIRQTLRLEIEIKEHERAEEEVRLLQQVTLVISEAKSFEDALSGILQKICEIAGWDLGQAWVPMPDGHLKCSPSWYAAETGFESFRQTSETFLFFIGKGLSGQAWKEKRAVWIRDIRQDSNFSRISVALEAGIKAGFAVPVFVGEEIVTVLEFFQREVKEKDERQIGIISDIAAQLGELLKRLKERKRLEGVVIQSEKMAALGQLAAGIAHEVNNPIAAILGFSQTTLKRLPPGDSLEMPLQTIEREALRCKTIVQDLLSFSRLGKTEKTEIDLNAMIEGALSFIIAQTKVKNVELVKELEAGLPPIAANKNQLQQVIVNLSNNAIDAMPRGGKLKISTRKICMDHQDSLEIQIQDTGDGMPEGVKAKIFEPFFTTKGEGKGTGLGLPLVQNIVEQHQGKISVESELGKGTTFHIAFPLFDFLP